MESFATMGDRGAFPFERSRGIPTELLLYSPQVIPKKLLSNHHHFFIRVSQESLVGQPQVIEVHMISWTVRSSTLQCIQRHLKARYFSKIIVGDTGCWGWVFQDLNHVIDIRKAFPIEF